MSIRDLMREDYELGKLDEQYFCELTGAEPLGTEWELRHVDCVWKGRKIDVKGLKRGVDEGYLLVEFTSVSGARGWVRGEADGIAFRVPGYFLVVGRSDLLRLAQSCLRSVDVTRRNGLSPSECVGRLCGRVGRKDVFTYVYLDDVFELPHVKVRCRQA